MTEETKPIKVNKEDWETLTAYLMVEQARQRKRLSFAELIHQICEAFVIPELKKPVTLEVKGEVEARVDVEK